MSSMPTIVSFVSAYRQLRPAERAYVDSYVTDLEREANKRGERISLALYRVIPQDVLDASRGMLERPMVTAAITERINQLAADAELSPQRAIKEVMALAFSSIAHYGTVTEDGRIDFDLRSATPEQLAAIKTIKVEMDPRNPNMARKYEIVLHDKIASLKMLFEYMGLLAADNPVWRMDNARPVGSSAIPVGTSVPDAANLYARAIDG